MKRLLAFLLLLASVALAQTPRAIIEVRASAFNLWEWTNGTLRIICSGGVVRLGDHTVFLSAGHCASDAEYNKDLYRFYISRAYDPDALYRVRLIDFAFNWPTTDWSVFRVPEKFDAPALSVCDEPPDVGEAVWAWTGPLGILPVLRQGFYGGPMHWPDSPQLERDVGGMWFVQINGDGGSSGSLMLRVVGEKACVWGQWVGGLTPAVKLDGALVVPVPDPSAIWWTEP